MFVNDNNHSECNVLPNLTLHQLTYPTEVIIPKVDSKMHAQYFFSKPTLDDLLSIITRLKINRVLCIGTPRIHEFIVNKFKDQITSILLDLDKNYVSYVLEKNMFSL